LNSVLVVESVALFREPVVAALRHEGYATATATTAEQAMNYLQGHAVDVLVVDIAMPDVNGLDLLRTIRSMDHYKHVPVIVLADGTDRDMVLAVGRLGIRHYISKAQFSLEEFYILRKKKLGLKNYRW